ncbi:hypothetical protein BDW42DRAFT_167659 [Aspergillus taichungensis]|uniref:Phytanoyl-CoA dioxygenase family protein n=1 Tax=Aspergillus taichungensis TaxID=482145 RepID=A0A2J5HXE0_9EURO|nr:hypothetical protein BDW42DRAFT_167659 [Aspergillus taichungensis]
MSHLASLQRDGYVLIPSLLTPEETAHLRTVATKATEQARTGTWPFFRTVPKQFPPWPSTPPPASEGGIWGVQHLLHPDMPGRADFARLYFSEKVLSIVEELIGCDSAAGVKEGEGKEGKEGREQLVMELFNLLVAPETRDFELRWHRDDVPETATPDEELRMLEAKSPGGRQSHAQYNLALCEDASLVVVPGSHRRVRTETERAAGPYEASLPGQVVVELKPGDAVFYDSNILHRGVYRGKAEGAEESRLTLHGSVGLVEGNAGAGAGGGGDGKVRATAVLQHGVGAWIQREDAAFEIGGRAEGMRANLMAMGTGEGVGYSLQG